MRATLAGKQGVWFCVGTRHTVGKSGDYEILNDVV